MYLIQVAREVRRFVRNHTHYTRGIKNRLLYGKGAPAFAQLYYINPKEVKLVQKKSALYRKFALSGMVMRGDWDLQTYPVSELEKYHICRKHFVDGLSWEEAGAYANMARAFEEKPDPDGCRTWDDVKRRLDRLDELFETIKKERKLLTQKELKGRKAMREKGGIYMHFNRHGEPIFSRGGSHRFSISLILELEEIPIQIGVIHKDGIDKFIQKYAVI